MCQLALVDERRLGVRVVQPGRGRGGQQTPGRTAARTRPGRTACRGRQRREVDDHHLVGDRLGEQRPVLEVVGVDVVGQVELVGGAPHHDLAPDLDVEARGDVDEGHVGRVALEVEPLDVDAGDARSLSSRDWLAPSSTGSISPTDLDVLVGRVREEELDAVLVAADLARLGAVDVAVEAADDAEARVRLAASSCSGSARSGSAACLPRGRIVPCLTLRRAPAWSSVTVAEPGRRRARRSASCRRRTRRPSRDRAQWSCLPARVPRRRLGRARVGAGAEHVIHRQARPPVARLRRRLGAASAGLAPPGGFVGRLEPPSEHVVRIDRSGVRLRRALARVAVGVLDGRPSPGQLVIAIERAPGRRPRAPTSKPRLVTPAVDTTRDSPAHQRAAGEQIVGDGVLTSISGQVDDGLVARLEVLHADLGRDLTRPRPAAQASRTCVRERLPRGVEVVDPGDAA